MKFARYLQDTQTPEWKRAYIDYRRLKKRIAVIRKAQDEAQSDLAGAQRASSPSHSHGLGPSPGAGGLPASTTLPPLSSSLSERPVSQGDHKDQSQAVPSQISTETRIQKALRRSTTQNPQRPALPLHELLPLLTPAEAAFFTLLDSELDKVESFYLDREKEFLARTRTLEEQLRELGEHRRLFYAAHPVSSATSYSWMRFKKTAFDLRSRLPKTRVEPWRHKGGVRPGFEDELRSDRPLRRQSVSDIEDTRTATADGGSGSEGSRSPEDRNEHRTKATSSSSERPAGYDPVSATTSGVQRHTGAHTVAVSDQDEPFSENVRMLDPDDYTNAKKKLKAAVLEHYRGLEVLNNYRILNITGFRKALKKFEKVTKISAMEVYMKEKVNCTPEPNANELKSVVKIEPSAFASGKPVSEMTKEIEDLFAARFEHGDKKKAMSKLRITPAHNGRHSSSFRSGLFLGLAVPAFASGLYESFQQDARTAIPGWATLLFIYGVFVVPVIFAFLVGFNLLAWSRSRINYVFIFELEFRTHLDSREYFEAPALLLSLLVYAFWLSFHRIGSHVIDPTIWPLIWLGFTILYLVNPLPILQKSSRWWFLKIIGRLFISGATQVEFRDFWMGDQFCSMVFTLSNLYFVACVYGGDFLEASQRCMTPTTKWPIAFMLSALPFFMRLVQSLKRYADSKLITHLVNGGKYGAGIVASLFYAIWRHQGRGHSSSLALWCLSNTLYAIYASSWDLLMDWSVLRPRATYPFLRLELVYTNHIPVYYFAIISNVLLRFTWIAYIPSRGPSMLIRTFVTGMLEMMRRWQWNFYRLENEHLGNMDQYRVTREVPLPYPSDQAHEEDPSDEDRKSSGPRWMRRRIPTVSPANHPGAEVIRLH